MRRFGSHPPDAALGIGSGRRQPNAVQDERRSNVPMHTLIQIVISPTLAQAAAGGGDSVGSLPAWLPLVMLWGGLALLAAAVLSGRTTRSNLRQWILGISDRLATRASSRRKIASASHDLGPSVLAAEQAGQRLSELSHDVEELAQRLAIELDGRAARVEELLSKLDDRIERLERLSPASAAIAGHGTRQGDLCVVLKQEAAREMLSGTSPAAPAMATTAPAAIAATVASNAADSLTAQVARLADKGLSPVEIAKQLGQHTGKVELILALRR